MNHYRRTQHSEASNLTSSTEDRMQLSMEHAAAVKSTESYACQAKTIQDHNRRLGKMIDWVKTNYSSQAMTLVRELSDDEKSERELYYKSTHDFVYEALDPLIIKAFISANKVRGRNENGNEVFYSYDHLRKYKDAILFGAKRNHSALPSNYEAEMAPFMESFKKENQSKKKLGQVKEQEADPISFALFRHISKSALDLGDIFLWCFTVMQWNCMARSINIGNLRFNCLSVGQDSIIVKYWDTKKDKTGEKTSPKNCYANPFDPAVCIFLSLGCYLAINDETYSSGRKDTIFTTSNTKETTGSQKYCRKLSHFLKESSDTVKEYIRLDHANGHGIRKGAAIKGTSGTTCPPPPSSVAHRGEWSLGKVFDIYWLFAESGDQYLGRILAGLDPNSIEFAVLPPHFIVGIENEWVRKGMSMCFTNIMTLDEEDDTNMTGILLRCLASIVYHSEFLKEIIKERPGHSLYQISVLNDNVLLGHLKEFITTEKSEKITAPTGIPPHIGLLSKIEILLKLIKSERNDRQTFEERLANTVENSIEQHAIQNGHLTYGAVKSILNKQQDEFKLHMQSHTNEIHKQLKEMIASLRTPNNQNSSASNETSHSSHTVIQNSIYGWGGKFYQVPSNFSFPKKTKRKRAWELWLRGQPGFQLPDGSPAPIIPFRKIDPLKLPPKQRGKFKTEWRPILTRMNEADGLPEFDSVEITDALFEMSFRVASNHLQARVCSFLFDSERYKRIEEWSVSTWSRYVSFQYIQEHGNESDKANLPPPTHLNRKRKRNE